jgi:hypothetical protein
MGKHSKASDCINESFKSIDLYGQPIALTIKGKERTTSFIGGVVTFFLLCGLLGYALATMASELGKPFVWELVSYERNFNLREGVSIKPHDLSFVEGVGIEDYMSYQKNKIDIDWSYGHFEMALQNYEKEELTENSYFRPL